jgi:hypothetical protein
MVVNHQLRQQEPQSAKTLVNQQWGHATQQNVGEDVDEEFDYGGVPRIRHPV